MAYFQEKILKQVNSAGGISRSSRILCSSPSKTGPLTYTVVSCNPCKPYLTLGSYYKNLLTSNQVWFNAMLQPFFQPLLGCPGVHLSCKYRKGTSNLQLVIQEELAVTNAPQHTTKAAHHPFSIHRLKASLVTTGTRASVDWEHEWAFLPNQYTYHTWRYVYTANRVFKCEPHLPISFFPEPEIPTI